MSVDRFDVADPRYSLDLMDLNETGDWVRYEDYEALLKMYEELKHRMESLEK